MPTSSKNIANQVRDRVILRRINPLCEDNVDGRWMLAFVAVVLLAVSLRVSAQEPDEASNRVGRVADVSGQLFLAPEDRATEWAPIELNYPIGNGDNLW